MSHEFENYTPEIPSSTGSRIGSVVTPESQPGSSRSVSSRNKGKSGKPDKGRSESNKQVSARSERKPNFWSRIKPWCTANNLHLILGFVLGALGIYLAIAFIGYFTSCIKDQALVNNLPIGHAKGISNPGGEGGARISEFLINECFGAGSFVIVVWLLALSLRRLTGWPRFKPVNFTIKCLIALITVSLIVGLLTIAAHSPVNWGGYHGRYVNQFVIDFLGWSGGVILCVLWVAIFVVFCLRDLINWIVKKKKERDARLATEAAIRAEEERQRLEIEEMRRREAEELRASGEAVDGEYQVIPEEEEPVQFDRPEVSVNSSGADRGENNVMTDQELGVYSLPEEYEPDPVQVNSHTRRAEGNDETSEKTDNQPSDNVESASDDYPHHEGNQQPTDVPEEYSIDSSLKNETPDEDEEIDSLSEKLTSDGKITGSSNNGTENDPGMVINVNNIDKVNGTLQKSEGSIITYPYEFPKIEFLREGVEKISVDTSEQLENKEKIRKTLLDFGIPIVSIEATVGPTVTLYEIRPDTGVKIAKIRNLVDDIALSLAAVGVRIIAPIPGKGTVGIEVANKDPQTVSMRTVIQSKKFQTSKAKLPIGLGSTISNEVYVSDLSKMPHLLVAGATGQGKSVGLNAIIASLLYSKRPEELKFVMIDPKRVEFSLYAMIESHYLAKIPDADEPIITDMKKVVATLSSLCVEMENRYDLLKNAGVRNIDEYNEKFKANRLNSNDGHRFLPYIVVIIDEFSDLIMTAGKEVETPIARLAQMARAVGMHVIIATQRPSTNVITGVIKANFPARIAFKVSSGVDSKTILDTTGAQQLIGRGDLLVSMNSETVRVQCAFIDTPEVEKICEYVMKQPYGKGAYILPEPLTQDENEYAGEGTGTGLSFGDRDPLFAECARYVVMARTASASSLQRRYSIGYNRAGKIMDQMEALEIVGPTTGGKARDVLIDSISLERLLSENGI